MQKPKTGQLIRTFPHGAVQVLEKDKPFFILQSLRTKYIKEGITKESLKITY